MKKGFSLFQRLSMRNKLLLSFLITSGIMALVFFCVVLIFSNVVESVADSYKTNSKLDEYSLLITQTQNALDEYMQVRTFESINKYYNFRSKLENNDYNFPHKPSNDEIAFLEYKVRRLQISFLQYAEAAISARRANNPVAADYNYKNAVKVYSMLNAEVGKLNSEYFHKNIARYNFSLGSFRRASSVGILALLVLLFLDLIIVYVLVTNITRPLVEISKVAHRIAERHFDIPLLPIESQDEVGNICLAFNRMIVSIREYIDTIWENAVKETELKEKEIRMAALYKDAQLKALQAQINPHFLFNTLNTGAGLATMEGADKTCYFIEQIADFFRYNIQQVDRDTTLGEELRIVDNYVYIMKVRFGNKFVFEKQIETENLNARMPSMILQPLVENCIRHGLAEFSSGGVIKLAVSWHGAAGTGSAGSSPDIPAENAGTERFEKNAHFSVVEKYNRSLQDLQDLPDGNTAPNAAAGTKPESTEKPVDFIGGYTQITICDNGGGISPGKRKELLSRGTKQAQPSDGGEVKEGHGIGLYNVIERLRLYYASDQVFDIDQNPAGQGACFIVRIPNVQHSADR